MIKENIGDKIKTTDAINTVCKKIDNTSDLEITYFDGTPMGNKSSYKNGRGWKILNKNKDQYTVSTDIKQCRTKIKDNKDGKEYDATYDVIMSWHVYLKGTGSKQRISNSELFSILAYETPIEAELRANANKEVTRLVQEWYSKNAKTDYFASKIDRRDVPTYSELLTNLTNVPLNGSLHNPLIIEDGIPTVRVYVDSSKYISQDSFYVNDRAFYDFRPKFTIRFLGSDYKQAYIESVDFAKTFNRPTTYEAEQQKIMKTAKLTNQLKDKFKATLENYSQNPTKENTDQFKALFTKNATVEVARITPKGDVKRETPRKAADYLRNLKRAKATVNIERMNEPSNINVASEPWQADVEFVQSVDRDRYCDHTKKVMHLVKDENGEMKIEKITVVEDPTPCEQ